MLFSVIGTRLKPMRASRRPGSMGDVFVRHADAGLRRPAEVPDQSPAAKHLSGRDRTRAAVAPAVADGAVVRRGDAHWGECRWPSSRAAPTWTQPRSRPGAARGWRTGTGGVPLRRGWPSCRAAARARSSATSSSGGCRRHEVSTGRRAAAPTPTFAAGTAALQTRPGPGEHCTHRATPHRPHGARPACLGRTPAYASSARPPRQAPARPPSPARDAR